MQRVQALHPDDCAPRIAFAQWYLWKCATDPLSLCIVKCNKVLFSDEASFTREETFNAHNTHMRAEENAHAIRRCAAQTFVTDNSQFLGLYYSRSPHRTLPVTVSSNRISLLALSVASIATTFGR